VQKRRSSPDMGLTGNDGVSVADRSDRAMASMPGKQCRSRGQDRDQASPACPVLLVGGGRQWGRHETCHSSRNGSDKRDMAGTRS
jgi:hypothetical protein